MPHPPPPPRPCLISQSILPCWLFLGLFLSMTPVCFDWPLGYLPAFKDYPRSMTVFWKQLSLEHSFSVLFCFALPKGWNRDAHLANKAFTCHLSFLWPVTLLLMIVGLLLGSRLNLICCFQDTFHSLDFFCHLHTLIYSFMCIYTFIFKRVRLLFPVFLLNGK